MARVTNRLKEKHPHSIVNQEAEALWAGVSAWSCGVDTVSDTENHVRQFTAVVGTHWKINA